MSASTMQHAHAVPHAVHSHMASQGVERSVLVHLHSRRPAVPRLLQQLPAVDQQPIGWPAVCTVAWQWSLMSQWCVLLMPSHAFMGPDCRMYAGGCT